MEQTIFFKDINRQISFSDFDSDGEVEIIITDSDDKENFFWLKKEDLKPLKKHIEYLIKTSYEM